MTEEEIIKEAFAMPLTAPAFPPAPYYFVNREYWIVTYRTDPKILRKVVPEPLQVPEPLVKFEFIRMPDSSGFGDYTESGQVIPVTFQGKPGGYVHAMYLNDHAAIAAGRELLGFPKMLGAPQVSINKDCIVCTLDYNGVRIADLTMAFKYNAVDKELALKKLAGTAFNLKIIPHVDGTLRICELVRYHAENVTVKGAWTGPGTLALHPHPLATVAALPVLEIVSAEHFLADLSLGGGEVAYDYLHLAK
jgi:acetoacetate decarboxylase